MKLSKTLIFAIILFVVVNTQFLWEGELGFLTFLIDFILFVCVVVLFVLFVKKGYKLVREKVRNRRDVVVLFVLFVKRGYKLVREKVRNRRDVVELVAIFGILCIIAVWPYGIIQRTDIESPAIMKASRRGVAGSSYALYLKEDGTFRDRQICFGVYDETGTYRISNDTIYFFSDDYQFDYAVMDSTTIRVHMKRAKDKNALSNAVYYIHND